MRIVFISDTHLINTIRGTPINLPEGDVLVHCGDALNRGSYLEFSAFATWFSAQPFKRKVFVPGNHDVVVQHGYENGSSLKQIDWCDVLIDSGVVIDGVKFWGSPWQPEFCNWAWNLPRGPELKKHWDLIPNDTDVLVTHTPPMGVLDTVWRTKWVRDKQNQPRAQHYQEHVGCADMMEAVKRVNPKVHAFGHVHQAYGSQSVSGLRTVFMNCALANERYELVNKPQVFDL